VLNHSWQLDPAVGLAGFGQDDTLEFHIQRFLYVRTDDDEFKSVLDACAVTQFAVAMEDRRREGGTLTKDYTLDTTHTS
jgi:hypothetical protein